MAEEVHFSIILSLQIYDLLKENNPSCLLHN
jgi:hypothetical protein